MRGAARSLSRFANPGILALASVGPILTVLAVGLYTQRMQRKARSEEAPGDELASDMNPAEVSA